MHPTCSGKAGTHQSLPVLVQQDQPGLSSSQLPGDAIQARRSKQICLAALQVCKIRAPGLISVLQDTGGGNKALWLLVRETASLSLSRTLHWICACWAQLELHGVFILAGMGQPGLRAGNSHPHHNLPAKKQLLYWPRCKGAAHVSQIHFNTWSCCLSYMV